MPPTSAPSPCGVRWDPSLGQEVGEKCAAEHESVVQKALSGWSPYEVHVSVSVKEFSM